MGDNPEELNHDDRPLYNIIFPENEKGNRSMWRVLDELLFLYVNDYEGYSSDYGKGLFDELMDMYYEMNKKKLVKCK